jgi:hypothetical protein
VRIAQIERISVPGDFAMVNISEAPAVPENVECSSISIFERALGTDRLSDC